MNDNYPKYNQNNPSQRNQLQEQILMQSKEQLQDQKYSNLTMAMVLSTAENLTWRLCEQNNQCLKFLETEYSNLDGYIPKRMIFNSYNSYNSGVKKPINSLINQFIFQIENFSDDFMEFESKYTKYSYPQNLQKEDIIKILDLWIKAIEYNDQTKIFSKYFKNLKNIFLKSTIVSYEHEIREQYKGNPRSGKADPRIIQKEYCNAINEIGKRTNDIDNQNIDMWKK